MLFVCDSVIFTILICTDSCLLFVTVLQKKEMFVKQFMKQLSREIAKNNDYYKPHMIKHRYVSLCFNCFEIFLEFRVYN